MLAMCSAHFIGFYGPKQDKLNTSTYFYYIFSLFKLKLFRALYWLLFVIIFEKIYKKLVKC